jgi:aminoglycoside 6'-N-acetyltransferase I
MIVVDLHPAEEKHIQQAAGLLVEAFKEHWSNAWPTMQAALEEVREALNGERINRIALDERGDLQGWIGGIPEYAGNAWELHPLVVKPGQQRKGIGRALVADLERLVRARGGITIYLGTDDEDGMTTLAHTDLYPNVWEHIARIRNLCGHPYEFYQKLGYAIVGVIPDANGPGKPDILMAKRLS